MKKIFFIILVFAAVKLNAQEKVLPAEAKPFVVKGYEMMDYITGDLNGDKRPDAILILKQLGEDTVSSMEGNRPFIILIRQANGILKQVKRNDSAMLCRQCGGAFGDPYDHMTISKNGFTIDFYGGSSWRWGYTYRFNYKSAKNNWYLVNEKEISYQDGDPEKTSKEAVIGETELEEVTIDNFSAMPTYTESQWKVTAAKTFFYDSPQKNSKPRKGYLLKDNAVKGIRELTNFVEVSYENTREQFTTGYVIKKDLVKIK